MILRPPRSTRTDTLLPDTTRFRSHERSLNIDFRLGYLKQLLQRRRDLKVIVTSATIDTERFAAHFGGAPVVNVEGRGYPVEVRYRALGSESLSPDDSSGRQRSEERRVGKECVSTCRSRWSPYH